MGSISALLNAEPRAAVDSLPQPEHAMAAAAAVSPKAASSHDAADALTTLATLGSGQQYVPAPVHDPTSASAPSTARRSSFGSHRAPMEPSPPTNPPVVRSPTLEHYHHGSRSPEEQMRRQSLMAGDSPPPVLAPIKGLSNGHHHEHVSSGRPSPQPFIKHEPSGTPRDVSPAVVTPQLDSQQSAAAESLDAETLKAMEIAKHSDLGLRAKRNASVAESVTSHTETKPAAPSKKRPAPSITAAAKKKGTAKALKPNKKRKIDTELEPSTRSVTPTGRTSRPPGVKSGKKGSQTGTPAAESSPAHDHSSQVHASDEEPDSDEDQNLYCICRKPDNHKWMIGCDGGCDDWFHGDCINMKQADEDLVDRFICPSCEEAGKGSTTWKPMCRRDGCRKPCRSPKTKGSKYCSDECGVLFMSAQLQRTAGAKELNGAYKPKRTKKKSTDATETYSDDDEEPTPLGGVLRAKDLKALTDASPNIQAFKALGSGVLSPPQTASPTRSTFPNANSTATSVSTTTSTIIPSSIPLTSSETLRLTALHNEKSQLHTRLALLRDREKFVSMVKDQAARTAEREKSKPKDFCGYDARLAWSDAEFLAWRESKEGGRAFKLGVLGAGWKDPAAGEDDEDSNEAPTDEAPHEKELICMRKRCAKHPTWQKLNLQDARFEELEIVEAIRECEKEERSVRERARRRGVGEQMAREIRGEGERGGEGWVEVVGGT